ncbi:MAG: spermidine synthase [Deltaproteobacteria bacterium]|nr:MAG: spermidine synthase [Deltaproteobacteria bacterium]
MSGPASGPIARHRTLFLLFFLSGMSGLVYESIWSRYIRQFVGSAATAQVLVLALFMGGMSAGALLAGRYVHRIRRPVVAYGLIEGCIGLYALAFPTVFDLVTRLAYDVLFPAFGGGAGVEAAKWLLAASLIVGPCILLGMTFPVMSVGILRRDPAHSGEILSFLYFTNSLGASLGAILSGFVGVAFLGLPGTLAVAGVLNILILLVALRDREAMPVIEGARATSGERRTLGLLFLAVAFGTGLSSFMYEIGWIRLLSMIIGSATHSFEVMLSAFVLGLALGGLWVRRRMDRYRFPELVLAFVQLVMGMAAVATLPLYMAATGAMAWLLSDPDGRTMATWIGFNVLRYLVCLMIMLPATFCAGMTLPLLTHVLLRRGEPEGVVGRVYGVNTLGSITGAVAAGIVLLPVVGLKGVIVLGALVDMGLGIWLLAKAAPAEAVAAGVTKLRRRAAVATAAVAALGMLVPMDPRILTSTVFRKGRFRLPDYLEILSYRDGRTASVTVVENTERPGHRIIYTNGKPDASVVLERFPEGRDPSIGPDLAGDEPNQFLVGLLPLSVHPTAKTAALIGFGSGVTCHTLLGSAHLERLDTIEIEPEMVRGGKFFFAVNHRAYDDPRNHMWFDDAKAYFAAAARDYDIIVSEPTNPWVSGVASLFTREFYAEAKRYLAPGGIFAQWLQGYEISNDLILSVLAAVDEAFEDYLIMRIGERDWVILASADGPVRLPDATVFEWPDAREQLEILGISDLGQIHGLIVANRRILHPFVSRFAPNSDAHPRLDTGAERTRFFRDSAEMLLAIWWTPLPVIEVFGGIERVPYPRRGIGDYRDPHVLFEPEQAMWLLRDFEEGGVARTPEGGVSVGPMRVYRETAAALDRGETSWGSYLTAVYEVFRLTEPYVRLSGTAFWADVRRRAADAPPGVREGLDLLDAVDRRDAPAITRLVATYEGADEGALPGGFVALAGALALELSGASLEERRRYAREQMANYGLGETDADLAFRALRAYVARGTNESEGE